MKFLVSIKTKVFTIVVATMCILLIIMMVQASTLLIRIYPAGPKMIIKLSVVIFFIWTSAWLVSKLLFYSEWNQIVLKSRTKSQHIVYWFKSCGRIYMKDNIPGWVSIYIDKSVTDLSHDIQTGDKNCEHICVEFLKKYYELAEEEENKVRDKIKNTPPLDNYNQFVHQQSILGSCSSHQQFSKESFYNILEDINFFYPNINSLDFWMIRKIKPLW